MNTTLIRFDVQSAYEKGIEVHNPKGHIESMGIVVVRCKYSEFGGCYFVEVNEFMPDPSGVCVRLDTDPKTFNWGSH